MNIITDFTAETYQLWLILGGVLLALELLGAAGYGLWCGIAAIIVALIVFFVPIGWPLQWIIFSILSIVVVIAWWRWSQSRSQKKLGSSMLNRPYLSFIGTHCTLIEPINNGFGRVKIADSSWRVKSKTDLPQGTTVVVESIEGNTLVVTEAKSK